MQEYIGERVKLHIDRDGHDLFYSAKILNITDTHISFLDKFNKKYCYRLTDVVEINDEKTTTDKI